MTLLLAPALTTTTRNMMVTLIRQKKSSALMPAEVKEFVEDDGDVSQTFEELMQEINKHEDKEENGGS